MNEHMPDQQQENAAEFDATMRRLSAKQQLFVWAYVKTASATGAARTAGYKFPNKAGNDNVNNADINQAIKLAQRARWSRMEADADRIMRELIDMLEADIVDALDENGALLPLDQWSVGLRRRLSGLKVSQRGTGAAVLSDIKLTEPMKLIELLGKHINVNAFRETVVIDSNDAFTARLEAARRKALERDVTPQPVALPASTTKARAIVLE
jgi:phage terminase small subunit